MGSIEGVEAGQLEDLEESLRNSNSDAKQSTEFRSQSFSNSMNFIDADADGMEKMFRRFNSQCSRNSNRSFNRVFARSKLKDLMSREKARYEVEEASETKDGVEQANIKAKSLRRKEFGEALKNLEAEDITIEDEALEKLCAEEIRKRKEIERLLAREKQEVQEMKNQQDILTGQLRMVQNQNSSLKNQITESQCNVTELEEKIISAVELLISFKEKRDKLKIEHGNVVRKVKELRRLVKADATYLCGTEFPTFSFIEMNEATHDFDPSWKIGDGKYGSVYKGMLGHVQVAIRMLPSYGCQSQLEFLQQVEVLSRVRHPNLLTLVGCCPESRSLIYEYLNNGSLEEHLDHKNKIPLPWQIRISIAANICSALIFLHASEPSIIHGNLKPSKVLLDANFVAKLGDLGISCVVPQSKDSADTTNIYDTADGGLVYVDPEYLVTGKLAPESDVYSFGIILLQLLTGRSLVGIVRDIKCALENENFKAVLDFSAGEWPLDQTKHLAYLALRCCEKTWLNRPDLSEIWSILEYFRASSVSTPPYLTSKKGCRPPSHFVCPIFQEVMKDPYIAADGFTYEADAISGWLNSGHNTSPMTNLKLEHADLVPNYALQNAIQEWQQLQ